MLNEWAEQWIARRQLKRNTCRKLRYEIAIWKRCGGRDDPRDCSFSEWQAAALQAGLKPRTINSVLSTIALLTRSIGAAFTFSPLPARPVAKHTPRLADINRLMECAAPAVGRSAGWWKRWLCFAYCTGLRRADLLALDAALIRDGELIVTAEKTGKQQAIPLPCTLLPHLPPESRFLRVGEKQLLRTFREWCDRASVPRTTPQGIRRLSAREWERAHAGCGAVILGHDVPGWSKATASYIDRSDLLRAGLPYLRLPDWIRPAEDESQELRLTSVFRRLSPPQRESLLEIVSSMSR